MMDIKQLKYLIALDETRHFGKAASQCNVTQPTLSMRIRSLEEELGLVLIVWGFGIWLVSALISFLPIFTLEAQEGRLFKPLAFTKTFAMITAAVLAITLDPAMRLLFMHARNLNFRPRWLAR